MVLNVHRNHKAYLGRGEGGYEGGGRGRLYLSLHCHHQNDSCIQMGSDERHFNVSVGRQCPQITTFLKRKESRSGIKPRSFRLPFLIGRMFVREPSRKYSSKLYSGSKKPRSTCSGNIRPIRRSLPLIG